jgi:BlaI family transcriptional regulator, penicillinase repressor
MQQRSRYGLGSLQTEVLEVIWELGEATVAQMVEQIGRRRHVSYTTVLVAVQKLEKKGWLAHRCEGRAYVFRPRQSKDAVGRTLLRDLLHGAFRGDPQLLLSSLLDEESLGDAELRELRALIERRRRERGHA